MAWFDYVKTVIRAGIVFLLGRMQGIIENERKHAQRREQQAVDDAKVIQEQRDTAIHTVSDADKLFNEWEQEQQPKPVSKPNTPDT